MIACGLVASTVCGLAGLTVCGLAALTVCGLAALESGLSASEMCGLFAFKYVGFLPLQCMCVCVGFLPFIHCSNLVYYYLYLQFQVHEGLVPCLPTNYRMDTDLV